MKKNILQTFEDFLREPLSILKKTIITIAGIETANPNDRSISVQTTDDGNIQINVINSKKAYNLLSCAVYKRQITELRHLINEDKKREIHKKFALSKISSNIQ